MTLKLRSQFALRRVSPSAIKLGATAGISFEIAGPLVELDSLLFFCNLMSRKKQTFGEVLLTFCSQLLVFSRKNSDLVARKNP